ncbi:hypothetical protein JCM8547_002737 [Rhodosporidiobolus lusitaniae]
MPLTLPSDLLLAIFELALPSIETFLAIAQPLLWRVFRPKSNKSHLAASFPRLAKHICVFAPREIWSEQVVLQAVKHMPDLSVFRLNECREVLKRELKVISHLEHVSFGEMKITSLSSVVFRNLVSLTIHRPARSDGSSAPLLPAASFPNLKALYTTYEH